MPNARYGSWGYFLLIVGLAGIIAFLIFISQESLNKLGISAQKIWTIWGVAFAVLLFGLIGSPVWWRWKQRRNQAVYKPQMSGEKLAPSSVVGGDSGQLFSSLKNHLRIRYRFFWRNKVRLLLITGDEAAIEQLVPGLQQQQWLEGNRTVLIYGGSLTAEPEQEKYAALRKLRRGRPLDGIVRVMPASLNLTPQISDNDLRGLEKIGEALRYQPPAWLWQLCGSNWSQDGRTEQAVGASFPLGANQEEVAQQLEQLLPKLTEQGTSQVAENISYDFLLRLGQKLKDGGIARWAQQLSPWLYSNQQRIPLRGLMFSLPQAAENTMADEAALLPLSRQHALTLPATWQGIVDDCTRVRGRRVGMAWEQMLAWGLMVVIGIWGAGMLLSFILNYSQISSVASKAHDLVEHPSVSDYQLTALHDLRNDAGRLQNHLQKGTPWYQRFGLDHNQQLLGAMLPWYGVANNRLIRDPANQALTQKLSALANSAPNSDQRAQLAKPGYDQLKAWLMMARADKVDAVFYAQTLKAVQPTRPGISTGLWQSLSPDLWAFYISGLPTQPEWKITPDAQLVSQSRHDRWSRSVVANWHTAFDGRFPFAVSKSDASLPMLAEFIRKDSGRIQPSTGSGAAYSGHIVEASSQILFVR